MRKRLSIGIATLTAFGLMCAFSASAMALPTYGTCSGCHTLSSSVTVKANQTANDGTNAAFSVTVSGPRAGFGWAVFDGSTKLSYGSAASGSFTVAVGKTYTVYGGNADGSAQLYNKVTISPSASGATSGSVVPTPTVTPAPKVRYVAHFNLHRHYYKGLKAVLTAGGAKYVAAVNRKGNATFKVPAGRYRLSAAGNKHYKFKARTITVRVPEENDD